MNKQPETESTAAAAYWAGHAAESAAEAREVISQGVHIEATGPGAERAHEAAERMRNGQERQRTLQDLMQEDQSPAMQALRHMRELVEAMAAKRCAYCRDPAVISDRYRCAYFVGIADHRTEFMNTEMTAIGSNPFLPVENWTFAVFFDNCTFHDISYCVRFSKAFF